MRRAGPPRRPGPGANRWVGLPRPFNWAHQGGAREGPPNTLFAFRRALANGADGLELDVHRTSDGHLVACHDPTLDRTTDLTGPITEKTLAEVRQADGAYWWVPGRVADHDPSTPGSRYVHRGKAPRDPDFRVPTLVEVMDAFPGVPLNLELKKPGNEGLLAAVLARDPDRPVIVAAFRDSSRSVFRRAAPEVDTAAGTWFAISFWLLSRVGIARRPPEGVVALQIPHRWKVLPFVDRATLRAAHRRHLAVHVWTIDDARRQRKLIEMGVDGIITDVPTTMARTTAEVLGRVPAPAANPTPAAGTAPADGSPPAAMGET